MKQSKWMRVTPKKRWRNWLIKWRVDSKLVCKLLRILHSLIKCWVYSEMKIRRMNYKGYLMASIQLWRQPGRSVSWVIWMLMKRNTSWWITRRRFCKPRSRFWEPLKDRPKESLTLVMCWMHSLRWFIAREPSLRVRRTHSRLRETLSAVQVIARLLRRMSITLC